MSVGAGGACPGTSPSASPHREGRERVCNRPDHGRDRCRGGGASAARGRRRAAGGGLATSSPRPTMATATGCSSGANTKQARASSARPRISTPIAQTTTTTSPRLSISSACGETSPMTCRRPSQLTAAAWTSNEPRQVPPRPGGALAQQGRTDEAFCLIQNWADQQPRAPVPRIESRGSTRNWATGGAAKDQLLEAL